jgi:hypothetical protein
MLFSIKSNMLPIIALQPCDKDCLELSLYGHELLLYTAARMGPIQRWLLRLVLFGWSILGGCIKEQS